MKNTLIKLLIASSLCFAGNNVFAQDKAEQFPTTQEGLFQAYEAKNWEQSISIAQELLKTEPENTDYLNILGISLAQLDKNEEAEAALEKVKSLMPEDSRVYANLCVVKKALRHDDSTIDTCIEATKRVTDDPMLFYITGQLLQDKSRNDEALKMFEAAYLLKPGDTVYLTSYTSHLSKKSEYAKVAEITEKAIHEAGASDILYLNAILAANRAGMYEKAIALADESFPKYNDPGMLVGKAEALTGLKKYEEADAIWSELEPLIEDKNTLRARLEAGYSKSLLARSCTTEAFKTCSTEAAAPCCAREKAALPLLESAQKKVKKLKKHEKSLDVNYGLAMILNHKLEDAEAMLTKAVNENLSQDNAGALAALAVALYQFDDGRDKEAARRYYKQAVEASPDFADIERIRETRIWPPRLLDTLKTIQDEVNAEQNQKNKKSGCSCDIQQKSGTPISALFAFILAIFGMIGLRRKSSRL